MQSLDRGIAARGQPARCVVSDGITAMACDETRQLVSEYELAAKKFRQAVSDLRDKAGTSAKKEYDRL